MLDDLKDYCKESPICWMELALVILCVVYLVFLGSLNAELASYGSISDTYKKALSVVSHNGGAPMGYFFFGLVLIATTIAVTVLNWKQWRDEHQRGWVASNAPLVVFLAIMVINIILFLLILAFLNNPIMWAICLLLAAGGALTALFS